MSDPIQPYTLSPHNAGIVIGSDGRFIWPAPPRKKVVIWGLGNRECRRLIPFDSGEFAIFSINNGWNASRDSLGRLRCDCWWEMHQWTKDARGPDAGRDIQDRFDMQWIDSCQVPIYLVEPYPDNPNAGVWPFAYYASKYRSYWTCTFAYQVATAIEEGFSEIHLFGLQLLLGTKREATVESSCLNYWLGLAEGRGVKVVIHGDQAFLLEHQGLRYGADYWLERRMVEQYVRRWGSLLEAV